VDGAVEILGKCRSVSDYYQIKLEKELQKDLHIDGRTF